MRAALLASVVFVLLPTISIAAEFHEMPNGLLDMTGDIRPGDAAVFAAAVAAASLKGNTIRFVFPDSLGGEVGEAMKIGRMVETNHMATAVLPNATCASACVLVLASGAKVGIAPGRRVGVHQSRTVEGGEAWASSYAMAEFLAAHHVAHSVTVKLLDTPPGGKTWLTEDDERASGWTVLPPSIYAGVSSSPPVAAPADPMKTGEAFTCEPVTGGASNGRPTSRLVWRKVAVGYDLAEATPITDPNVSGGKLVTDCRAGGLTIAAGQPVANTLPAGQQGEAAPLTIGPQADTAEVVEVPAPVVIPAPTEATPQVPAVPAVFRPIPAPADEAFEEVAAHCRVTWTGQAPREADCIVGHAPDGSERIHFGQDAGFVYITPNGPSSYLASLDGRSFDLSFPLTLSADRLCLSGNGFEGCAWTARPVTLLDGMNGLVAGLFGAAVQTEQRLGLLGN